MKQPATTDTPSVKAQNPTIITTISAIIVALIVMWGCWWYLSSTPLQTKDHFSFGSIASLGLQGFYDAETDTEWRGYRWTNGAATLDLDVQGDGGHILALTLAAPQPDATTVPVTLTLNQQPLATFDISQSRRHYLVLAPADAVSRGSNQLGINSPTFQVTGNPHDLRKLGVVAFDLEWQATQFPAWMLPTQAVALAITAALLFVCLQRAGIPWLFNLITIILFLAISISMRHSDVRFLYRWHALLSTGGIAALLGLSTLVLQPQPTPLVLPWRQWFQHHWQALVGYTVLTGIMLYQILQNFTTAIPGYHGDAYEYLWKFQVFSDYLINKHQTPTFFSWLMYPEGFELANSEITTANTLLGVPLTWLFGPTVSFNILVLISAISSGFLTYLLACRLGVSRLAAWVGAIAFAFAIRRTQQMMGHMPLMPTQYLVLALYGLEGMISRRRTWDAFLTGMGLALTTWASLYYGVTFIFFMAGYALLRIGWRNVAPYLISMWRTLLFSIAVFGALTIPFLQPYLELQFSGTSVKHPLIHLQIHKVYLHEYLLGNPFHPIWGQWMGQFYRRDGGEHMVALGASVIILSLLGIWFGRPRRLAFTLAGLSAITMIFTLGPDTTIAGINLNLPVRFIYDHVPVLSGIRVWNRFAIYVALAAALLIGMALSRLRGRQYYIGSGIAALVLVIELAIWIPSFVTGTPRNVDLWLREQPEIGAVIEMPYRYHGSNAYNAYQIGKPMATWSGTFDPPIYREYFGRLSTFPSQQSLAIIQRWGIGYVIVNRYLIEKQRPDWLTAIERYPEYTLVYEQGDYLVYRLRHGVIRE